MDIRATETEIIMELGSGDLEKLGVTAQELSPGSPEGAILTAALIARLRQEGWIGDPERIGVSFSVRDEGAQLRVRPLENEGRHEYCFRDAGELIRFCGRITGDWEGIVYRFQDTYLLEITKNAPPLPPSDPMLCAQVREHGMLLCRDAGEKLRALAAL